MKTPTAILCSDIHLREDQPICRLDEFWEVQTRKIQWLYDLQEKYDCPVIDAGDLFDKWKPSYYLLRWAILNLPNQFITVWGNHNLPYHSMDLYEKSGLGVMHASGAIKVLRGNAAYDIGTMTIHAFPWGAPPEPAKRSGNFNVALMHIMTYNSRRLPYPGCKDLSAMDLLDKMDGYDLIVTGHNHKSFVVDDGKCLLVNPGSLTRQTVDQIDHEPCAYLWYADERRVEPVYVPIEQNVITREHITKEEERENRFEAFVERANNDFELSLSYEKNLETYFSQNRVRSKVKEMVWSMLQPQH